MKKILAALAVLLMLVPLACVSASDGDPGGTPVLIDMGNGTTYWSDTSADDVISATQEAAASHGLDAVFEGNRLVSVSGISACKVGSQQCSWIFYAWDGSSWQASEASAYSGGGFAWGFYPDGAIVPAETPSSRTAWTMHRGDSSSSGLSDSYGTSKAVAPMEWYRTYTSGYVDSAIITAGDYLYHTTGGEYGASGSDRNPWVYCLNRLTGEVVWQFMMAYGQGYEVTSPLVIGDVLIVTATNWNVYCFDRFTGEVLHTLKLEPHYPMDAEGDIVWEGRTFYTGATTPVYDSGAMYFGTADGHIMAYSVSRDKGFVQLWDYDPDDSVKDGKYAGTKGCFYFHAPVIADVDGKKMLFLGSYEGYVHALDASTGEAVWVKRMINLGDANVPHKGTPGSAAGITVLSGGKLIIDCTDGGLSPQDGYAVCVDARTGEGPDGSECYWKLEVLIGGPVAVDDGFYAYVQPSGNGARTLETADGDEMEIVTAVYKLDSNGKVLWRSQEYGWIKAALTLADGIIYCNDYSAGKFWPNGGGVTAISAEDGSQIWRLKLSPYADDSYSMVSATVIDGKVYVANDYGAVYCISEIAGPEYGDGGEIRLGNGFLHWSWIVLILAVIGCLVFLWRFY